VPARTTALHPFDEVREVRGAGWPRAAELAVGAVTFAAFLRGDRAGRHDAALTAGLAATRGGRPVIAVAVDRATRPTPAAYRLARRAVALAARLRLPLVTFVDTPGADPSHESEQAGIAGEIARLMAAVTTHPVPTVSIVTGEGGSGGALAFAACDRLYLMEGAVFSVIAPEGAAAILRRDASQAAEVAPLLKLTGPDLLDLGIIDGIVDRDELATAVDHALVTAQPGDGLARFDRASARWLREPSGP
jgi:acetyl-CoA carboxylase carboxyl transferase subunit beta